MGKMKDIVIQLAEQGINVTPEPSENLLELIKRASMIKYTIVAEDCIGCPSDGNCELQDETLLEDLLSEEDYDIPEEFQEYAVRSELDSLLDSRSIYGSFKDKAEWIQGGKQAMRDAPKWEYLGGAEQEALDNIMQKIGRVLYGEFHLDNWNAIQTYAALVVQDD